MTGYGSAEIEREGQRLSAEVRSVNHRFCEVSIRAPKLVSPFEDQIRQLLQERFARGKINLTISWSGVGETGETLKVNDAVADQYVELLGRLRERYHIDSGLDLRTLAGLPDVFTWEHTALSDEETWGLLKEVVNGACDNMGQMKGREGEALARDFGKRLELIRNELDRIAERAPLRPQEAKDRLMTRYPQIADAIIHIEPPPTGEAG